MNLREIIARLRAEATGMDEIMAILSSIDQRLNERIVTIASLAGDLGGQDGPDATLMLLHDAATHAGQARAITFTAQKMLNDYLSRF